MRVSWLLSVKLLGVCKVGEAHVCDCCVCKEGFNMFIGEFRTVMVRLFHDTLSLSRGVP